MADPEYAGRLIEVRLAMDTERFEVEISDEGRGFDAGQLAPPQPDSEMAPHCGRGPAHHSARDGRSPLQREGEPGTAGA